MSLTGDFQKLDRWAKAVGEIDSPKTRFKVADEMADASLGLIAQGFGRQTDPFGNPWAPKKRPDGRPILQGKTGRLKQFRKGVVTPRGFRIDSNPRAPYFKFHQYGTERMKARRMVPGKKLPPRWVGEFRAIWIAAVRSQLSVVTGGGVSRVRGPRTRAA